MNSGSGSDIKEQVRQATDIVELIQSYLAVRREGRHYKALCPWHDDSRPSLHINADLQIFRCFVCNIGGDAFSFVMRMEQVDFREALEILAERANIPLKPARPQTGSANGIDKRALYQAAAWAEKEFYQCLLTAPEAEPARRYLRDRGISEESMRRFCLGYSPPDWEWLLRRARNSPHPPEVLERVGLVTARRNGPGYYDRYRGRVVFPIRDTQGRTVGMGGRVLPPAPIDAAKYINSPESPLFSKSGLLYGLDTARHAISRTGEAVVMEGYTDVIVARQSGFENTVAVLGTALGERHVQLLKRFADRVVLVLDGDEAGRRRANEVLRLFLSGHLDLRILTLPDNLDPCDFIARNGSEAFRKLLSEAVDALDHKIRSVTTQINPAASDHRAHAALEDILANMAHGVGGTSVTTSSAIREWQLLSRLGTRFHVSPDVLHRRLRDLRRKPGSTTEPKRGHSGGLLRDKVLLDLLFAAPELVLVARDRIDPEWLEPSLARPIYVTMLKIAASGGICSPHAVLGELTSPECQSLVVQLAEMRDRPRAEHPSVTLREVIAHYENQNALARRQQEAARIRETDDEVQALQFLIKEYEREKARQGLITPTDG